MNTQIPIELDRESLIGIHSKRPPRGSKGPAAPVKSPAVTVTVHAPSLTERKALAIVAGYGEPPESVLLTPFYALRVVSRQHQLRRDLAYAQRYRRVDISVYERALDSADRVKVRTGLAIIATVLSTVTVLATLLA